MGRNKETKLKKKAIKAAVAAKAEESKAQTATTQDEAPEVEMTKPPAEMPAVDTVDDAPEATASTTASDGPTLPSLYETKLIPGGGISIREPPTGYNKKAKKRARSEVDTEEQREVAEAEDFVALQQGKVNAANKNDKKQKGTRTLNDANGVGQSAKENQKPIVEKENVDAAATSTSKRRKKNNAGSTQTEQQPPAFDSGKKISVRKALNKIATSAEQTLPKQLRFMAAPWELLPPGLRKSVESHNGGEGIWAYNCVPVVIGGNQNIRSTTNRINTYLGAFRHPESPYEMPDALRSQKLIVAVSAEAGATSKLTTIIGIVKKTAAPNHTRSGIVREDDFRMTEEWCMYTSLSAHVVFEKQKKPKAKGQSPPKQNSAPQYGSSEDDVEMGDVDQAAATALPDSDNDSEPAFEDMQFDAAEDELPPLEKANPVLTVWLCRTPIPEFRDAFGEERVRVQRLPEEVLNSFQRKIKVPVPKTKQTCAQRDAENLKKRMSVATKEEIEAAQKEAVNGATAVVPSVKVIGDEVVIEGENTEGTVWKDADVTEKQAGVSKRGAKATKRAERAARKTKAGEAEGKVEEVEMADEPPPAPAPVVAEPESEAPLTSDGGVLIDIDQITALIAEVKDAVGVA
ncbi:hypothetical protein BCR34DRAFT_571887 [Clohesyomyces aquaticus]|uniref:Uncharacterized protein n=1 Tax=Clohesyomyces aquaticus TaxID=1231657 RepID=A0A1Y1Z5S3_9PLEO|nr:hypothetical protein BCR34DRAFT_571887 [Clohesyomyces aquaticus]